MLVRESIDLLNFLSYNLQKKSIQLYIDCVVDGMANMERYKVQEGETFSGLSPGFEFTLKKILVANPGVEPRKLQALQIINIPRSTR